ncbi:MAG TPA: SDR family NAD(P)-dependent oxidoreductase, partial [Acidobacteriaceae bacterium]
RDGEWERVSEGWLRRAERTEAKREDLQALQARLRESAAGAEFYAEMAERGMVFGERFRGVERLWVGEAEALGEVALRARDGAGWQMAPWWLDACLQVVGAAAGGEGLYLPVSAERLEVLRRPGERSWSHVRARWLDARTLVADVAVFHPDGAPLVRVTGLRFRKIEAASARTEICRVEWKEFEAQGTVRLDGHWLVLCEGEEAASGLDRAIRAAGGSCSVLAEASLKRTNIGSAEVELAFGRKLQEMLRGHDRLQGVVDLRAVENAGSLDGATDLEDAVRASARALQMLQTVLRENVRQETGVWLVTSGAAGAEAVSPGGAAVWALARTAQVEFPELAVRCVEIGDGELTGDLISALAESSARAVLMRRGRFFQPELVRQKESIGETGNSATQASPTGLIDLLQERPAGRREPRAGEIEIRVEAHGINFRDVLTALAMLPGAAPVLGGECAGTVVRAGAESGYRVGERVFAFAPGSLQAFVTVAATHVARVPNGLTMEQAAALPVVYLTALYGLDRLASLRRGETILIHAGAGGLGMAAVHLAKARGAEVYATAGSDEKRAYLRGLGVRAVFSSRTGEFAEGVLQATGGRGVDVILNSLTGDLAEKNLAVLASGGRLLEVGKRDTLSAGAVHERRPDVRYWIYDLGEEAVRDAALVPALLKELLRLLGEGSVAPLPVTEFPDVREAFRYMAQARHIGKVVVRRSWDGDTTVSISAEATYLVTGGCGGLGLIVAEWLVARGARCLVLMGRSAPSAAADVRIEEMRSQGAEVKCLRGDVANRSAMDAAFASIPKERPLRGILHLAGVLDDGSLLQQDRESLLRVMRPKWGGAWNLHAATEHLPLDFFVLFSSGVVSLGSPGQANYAAANAALDALARWRKSRGLRGLSVQWGPWGAAGMAEDLKTDLESCGLGRLTPDEGIGALERLLGSGEAVAAVLPVTSWHRLQRWQAKGDRSPAASEAPTEKRARGFADSLRVSAPGERSALLQEHLRQQVIHILSLPESTRIDKDEALHDLGLDSLMAVELRNALVTSLEHRWSPTLTLDYPTLRSLTEHLLAEMSVSEHNGAQLQRPEDMSEAEAEDLLLQELGRGTHDGRR